MVLVIIRKTIFVASLITILVTKLYMPDVIVRKLDPLLLQDTLSEDHVWHDVLSL